MPCQNKAKYMLSENPKLAKEFASKTLSLKKKVKKPVTPKV